MSDDLKIELMKVNLIWIQQLDLDLSSDVSGLIGVSWGCALIVCVFHFSY